jgi:hypothetical protein
MAKKKPAPKKKARTDKYDSKLSINGSLDDVLKVSVASAKKPEKK